MLSPIMLCEVDFTLGGIARLRYELPKPIDSKWVEVQNQFRKQYSVLGHTQESHF